MLTSTAGPSNDDRIADRDFGLGVAVIVLIGIEIVLSVYRLWDGYPQGKLIGG